MQCPSFNRCSSGTLEDVAARVIAEFNDDEDIYGLESFTYNEKQEPADNKYDVKEFMFRDEDLQGLDNSLPCKEKLEQTDSRYNDEEFMFRDDVVYSLDSLPCKKIQEENNEEQDEAEFEFPSLCNRHVAPVAPPVFPIFGRDLMHRTVKRDSSPLWKLMREERESPESCSSSETDDLEGVAAETYCVWNPEERRNKGGSMRSSRRWKIRDLLFRSNSDGKGNLVSKSSHQGMVKKVGGDGRRSSSAGSVSLVSIP